MSDVDPDRYQNALDQLRAALRRCNPGPAKPELQARIAAGLHRIAQQCREIIADVEAWNNAHPDEQPIDCEQERVLLAQCIQGIERFQ